MQEAGWQSEPQLERLHMLWENNEAITNYESRDS